MRGEVPSQNKTFAPSLPEFVDACKSQEEIISIRSKPRLPAPEYRPGPLAPYEIAQQKARERFRGRPVLLERVTHQRFLKLTQAQEIPPGATWSPVLGAVFGP